MTAFGDKYRKTTTIEKEPVASFGLKYRKEEEEEKMPKGPVGTWIDSKTYQGYSGPRRNTSDLPADPLTGRPLVLTPPKKTEALAPKPIATLSTLKPDLISAEEKKAREFAAKTKLPFGISDKFLGLFKKKETMTDTLMKQEKAKEAYWIDQIKFQPGVTEMEKLMKSQLTDNVLDRGFFGTVAHSFLPTRVLLEDKQTALKNAVVEKALNEYSQNHPVQAITGELIGGIANLILFRQLGAGFGIESKISTVAGGLKNLYPTLTRIVGLSAETATLWGITNAAEEAFSQTLKQYQGQGFGVGEVARAGLRGGVAGGVVGPAGAFATLPGRVGAGALAGGGLVAVEKLIVNKKITANDIVDIATNALLFALFQLVGGTKRTAMMRGKELENLQSEGLIARIMSNNPKLTKQEAKELVVLLEKLPKAVITQLDERQKTQIAERFKGIEESFRKATPEQKVAYIERIAQEISRGKMTVEEAIKIAGTPTEPAPITPTMPSAPVAAPIILTPQEPTPLTGQPAETIVNKLDNEIAISSQKNIEKGGDIETEIARTKDWISSVLTNDEASTDKELIAYFQKEGGFSKEVAEYIASKRGQVATLPLGVTKEMKEPSPEVKKAPQEAVLPEKGIIPQELQPLAQEARKYKSAEEFVNSFKEASKTIGKGIGKTYVNEAKFGEATITGGDLFKFRAPGSLEDFYAQATKEAEETPAQRKARATKQLAEFEAEKGKKPAVIAPTQVKELQGYINRDKKFAAWWRETDRTKYTGQKAEDIYNTFKDVEQEKVEAKKAEERAKKERAVRVEKPAKERTPEELKSESETIADIIEVNQLKFYPTLEEAKKEATKDGQISSIDQPVTQLDYVIYQLSKGNPIPEELNYLGIEMWKDGQLEGVPDGQGTVINLEGMFFETEETVKKSKKYSYKLSDEIDVNDAYVKESYHLDEVSKITDWKTLQDGWGADFRDQKGGETVVSKDIPAVKTITKGKRKGYTEAIPGLGILEDVYDDNKAIVFGKYGYQIVDWFGVKYAEDLNVAEKAEIESLKAQKEGKVPVAEVPIAVKKEAKEERVEEAELEPTEEMKAMESAELRDRVDELNNLLDTTEGDAREKVSDEIDMIRPLLNKFEKENEIISVDIKKGGSSVEIRTIEYSDGKFSVGTRFQAGTSGAHVGFRGTHKSEKGATATGIIEAIDFFQRNSGTSKKAEAEVNAILKQLEPMRPIGYEPTEKAEKELAPKKKTKKLKGEVFGDKIDEFVAGKISIRMPAGYDIKEDWKRTLGLKWYKKIFKWGSNTSINTPDQVASEMGLTENQLMDRVAARIKLREERIGSKQSASLKKNHPYVLIAKEYGMEWSQMTDAEKAAVKMWSEKPEAERGQFPMDEEMRLNARQRDIFGNDAKIDTEAEQGTLDLRPDKDVLTKPYTAPMTSAQRRAAEEQRLLAKQKGQKEIGEEEYRMPMKKYERPHQLDRLVTDYKQDRISKDQVESLTRDFETSLNVRLNAERAFDKLVELAREMGYTVRIAGTGWRKGSAARGKFSVSKDYKVIYGVALKELDDPIALGHEIGHGFDFVVIGKKTYLLELSDRIDTEVANWPTEDELIEELKNVSDYVRPFDRKGAVEYTRYRNRRRELVADFMTLYINDKDEARVLAPRFTEGLETAHPEIIKLEKDYQEAPIEKQIYDIPKKKLIGGLNSLVDMFRKVSPPEDVKILQSDLSKMQRKGQKMINLLGAPFWRGEKRKNFGKIYRAVQDEAFYGLSGEQAKQIDDTDIKTLHDMSLEARERISKAIYAGNDEELQAYLEPEELKSAFNLNDEEIAAYNRIVKVVKRATESLVEARKIKYGFYNLSPEERKRFEPMIRAQVERLGGYFPIDRFGEWTVFGEIGLGTFTELGENKEPFFALNDKKEEALKLAQKIVKMGYKNVSVYRVTELPAEFYKHLKKFSWSDLENIAEAAGVDSETPGIKKIKEYLQTRVWSRRLIHRKWVAGYERTYDNMIKTLSGFIDSSSRQLYKARATKRAYAALNEIDPRKDPETYAMAKNYIDNFFYTSPSEFYLARKGIYLYYLMFKTSFMVQNLTQPYLTTMPEIANYVGGIKAPIVFMQAMKDSAEYLRSTRFGRESRLDDITNRLIERAFKERVIGGMFTEQLLGVVNSKRTTFENVLGSFGIASETLNRLHGFAAGLRIAKKEGLTNEEEIYNRGKSIVERTQFPYGNQNLPQIIAGAGKMKGLAKVAIVFKMFQLNYLHFLSQRVMKGSKFIGPKAWGVGIMAALAGVLGLPFAGLIHYLLKKFTGFDFVAWVRRKLGASKAWMADMILHGAPTLANMSFTYLIGLGDIISANFDPMGQVLGAGYGILDRVNYGIELFKNGKVAEGLEQLYPVFLRNIIVANRWRKEGISFAKDIYMKPSTWEVVQKALGFTPAKVSKQYETQDIEAHVYAKYKSLKSEYISTWKKDGDMDKLDTKIEAWNTYVEDLIWVLYNTSDQTKIIKSIEKSYNIDAANKKAWREEGREELKKEESKPTGMGPLIKTAQARGEVVDEREAMKGSFVYASNVPPGVIAVGPDTKDIGDMARVKSAIAYIETSRAENPYTAKGEIIKRKDGTKDRAYGKYQVMGSLIPWYTETYLKKKLDINTFLGSPSSQEGLMEEYLKAKVPKEGLRNAITRWLTGQPYSVGATKEDIHGTSGADYWRKFIDNY